MTHTYTSQANAPSPYQDILNHSRPITTRTPLSITQRAAQFAPYKTITKFHDSTQNLESSSDHPETEIIFDDVQAEISAELYIDCPPDQDSLLDDSLYYPL